MGDENWWNERNRRIDVVVQLLIELGRLLPLVTEREARILKLRFGIETGRPQTLKEVADIFHVTRERIRQIETKVLAKLAGEL